MRWIYAVVATFFALIATPALADIVNVSFGGGVSGSGRIDAKCLIDPTCTADSESYSFSNANNNVADFSASGSTSADAGRVTLTSSIQQTTTISPTSFAVNLQSSGGTVSSYAEWGAQTTLSDGYSLLFTLTTTSILDLSVTRQLQGAALSFDPSLGLCSLLIPGSFIGLPCSPGDSFSQSFVLEPGFYDLNLSYDDFISFFWGTPPFPMSLNATDTLSVTAGFTPIVPESRWTYAVPALFLTGLCVMARRRREHRQA